MEAGPMAVKWQWDVAHERQLIARDRQEQQERDCRSNGEESVTLGDLRTRRRRTDAA